MADALDHEAVGRWRVTTRTGTRYLVDLDRQCVRREPARGGSSTSMHRDQQDVDLLQLMQCRIGAPLVLLLDLHLPGVACTRRVSSDVTRIRLATSQGSS